MNRDLLKLFKYNVKQRKVISTWRYSSIIIMVAFCYTLLIIRVFDLGFSEIQTNSNVIKPNSLKKNRSDIFDRNGVLLAINIPTYSLFAHPNQMINHENDAKKISKVLNNDNKQLLNKLNSSKDFIWIKRHITPEERQKIHNLGIPGLYFIDDEKRFYPHENLCSHILGYVDIDGNGLAGLEKAHDSASIDYQGAMQLSIDVRIQNILREEIQKATSIHNALGGAGIMIDVNSGEILGMVSVPDFNPNKKIQSNEKNFFNQASLSVNEMGSLLKVLTIAIGLDMKKININDAFDVSTPVKVGSFTINDYRGKGGTLSVPEILMYSSNIGTIQIGQKIGVTKQREYLNKFGIIQPIDIELPEVGKPLYPQGKKWSDISLITISYGHGIATTPLHTVQSLSAVVNGGILRKLTLLKKDKVDDDEPRIISQETSQIMRKLLRLVVKNGYGRAADVKGYLVGGKTGTAEKINNKGKYNKKSNIALFVGAFPMDHPQYMIFVALDDAKPNKINKGFTTGGMIAAPLAGEIIKRSISILDVLPREESYELQINYTPRYIRNRN